VKSSNNVNTGGGNIVGSVIGSSNSTAHATDVSITQHHPQSGGATVDDIMALLIELEEAVQRSDLPASVRETTTADVTAARAALKADPPDPGRTETFLSMIGEALKKAAKTEGVSVATDLLQRAAKLIPQLIF
jgi:hypothetical protein